MPSNIVENVFEFDSSAFPIRGPHAETGHRQPIRIPILHESPDILAVEKPSGLLTTSATDEPSLHSLLLGKLGPGSVHPTSRLDREVSGVVVFARTPTAIDQIARSRAENRYRRIYIGLAQRSPSEARGKWEYPIGIDPRDPRKRVAYVPGQARSQRIAVKEAATEYAVMAKSPMMSTLVLSPETGRTHQLRVHASAAGCPLLGDRLYGGERRITTNNGRVVSFERTMLHCHRVELVGVRSGEAVRVVSPVPELMLKLAEDLVGLLDWSGVSSIFAT